MASSVVLVIVAAGRGERLGQDKAVIALGAETAIERVVRHGLANGCDRAIVVRQVGAPPLPSGLLARIVEVTSAEMIESVRAGLSASADEAPRAVLVLPIDYAMVGGAVIRALVDAVRSQGTVPRICLPICRSRPGHPVAMTSPVVDEVLSHGDETLREVIRRDPARVVGVPVEDGWVLRDIDRPEDLRAALGALRNVGSATELMARHRSRRAYSPDPVGLAQLRWLVDSARHASTSSFIQASSVVAIFDTERKRRIASLCADQRHVDEAPVFLAICADLHRVSAACARHGKQLETDSVEIFLQATIDAALFGQNLQLAAESEGLGSCMIGAARNHPIDIAHELDLPPFVYVPFGMTLGWPTDDPTPRPRLDLGAVLHVERYRTDATDAALDQADAAMRDWACAENARLADVGQKPVDTSRGWTDRMAFSFGSGRTPKGRECLLQELRSLGFGLREPDGRDAGA